jgi:hypothetical protein
VGERRHGKLKVKTNSRLGSTEPTIYRNFEDLIMLEKSNFVSH